MVTVAPPDVPPFGIPEIADTVGESKVKCFNLVPTTAETVTREVTGAVCVESVGPFVLSPQRSVVVEVHAVVKHVCSKNETPAVGDGTIPPKLRPNTVIVPDPVFWRLTLEVEEMMGASNEKRFALVPTTAETVTVTPLPAPPIEFGPAHSTEEDVDQLVVAHRRDPSAPWRAAVGVGSRPAKLCPRSVRLCPADVGPFRAHGELSVVIRG